MFDTLKKLKYGARFLLSRGNGQPETVTISGRATVLRHAGEGTPFVYLHSTLGESNTWLPFHQGWARNFKVYAPAHPGFDKSTGLDQIDSIEDLTFHYVELFDALGLDQFILGGVSMGGWIAAEFAVRWPERVKGLWLADAPGLWIDEHPLPDLFRIMQEPDNARELLFHDPYCYMADLIFEAGGTEDERLMEAYQHLTVLARLLWERPYSPKLPSRLQRIMCPTLLLWGAHDKLVPPVYAQEYKKYLPKADLQLIENCGHLPMFECETEFVEAVTKFAKSC